MSDGHVGRVEAVLDVHAEAAGVGGVGGVRDGESSEVRDLDFATVDGDAHGEVGRDERDHEHCESAEEDVEEAVDGGDFHAAGVRIQGMLAAVVGSGFGVDEEAGDFWGVEFEGAFEGGHDGVNLGHGEVVGEGAVAGDLDAAGGVVGCGAAEASYEDFMDVQDLWEGGGDAAEAEFELAITFEGSWSLDGGGLGLDVGEDGGDFRNFAENVGLEVGDEGVCLAEGHGFVDFEVEFDVE